MGQAEYLNAVFVKRGVAYLIIRAGEPLTADGRPTPCEVDHAGKLIRICPNVPPDLLGEVVAAATAVAGRTCPRPAPQRRRSSDGDPSD